jgi:hypothetical protein
MGHEKIWDVANTLRIAEFKAPPLYGVGTDDSHRYHGEENGPGRGWVMVRASKLDPAEIVKAMKAGDFYASSGVTLDDVSFKDGELRIRIPPVADDLHPPRLLYSDDIGKTLATIEGEEVVWKPSGKELYFRAVITSSKPYANPSFEGQKEMAWTQPMGWKK